MSSCRTIRTRGVLFLHVEKNKTEKKGEIYFGFLCRLLAGCVVYTAHTYTHIILYLRDIRVIEKC